MANGGGVTFKFEQDSVQNIIERRGLNAGGKVQQYVDNEVMRYMEPYMPKLTGVMIESMVIATDVGSGEVVVDTPYSKKRSEVARNNGQRGPHFFERMKADRKDDILNGAAAISGGKAEK